MSLLNDILSWATVELTTWQRDAVRRLVQKGQLDQHDFDDLLAMLKSAHGLPDPQSRKPVPLAPEHLPANMDKVVPVILCSIYDLKHVNRIAPSQRLDFAPKGITLIYGGNASGKSGYSRVLKRACRARDLFETIHPNAFDLKAATSVPEATFDIEIERKSTSLVWNRDKTPPDELSTIAVFDHRCARAYLDTEQDAAYLPYGLDIVENLGQLVLPTLAQRLNGELEATNTDTTPFADLIGDTAVGKMIATLSASTEPEKVKALSTLIDAEKERLLDLSKTLSESDPQAKATALRLSAQRIDALISRIDTAVLPIADTTMEKLQICDDEAETALKAMSVAAEKLRAGEPLLPGSGEDVWRNLFDAARRFSTQIAYPDKSFPFVTDDSKCLLCQQPFTRDAAERMKRFEDFLKQDTARVADQKSQERQKELQEIQAASFAFGLDPTLTLEIKQLDAILVQKVIEWEKRLATRRQWAVAAFQSHVWELPPPLEGDPRADLKALSARLCLEASVLDRAGDEKERKTLEAEYAELQAREKLSPRQDAILNLIQRIQVKKALTECMGDLKTKAISDKAREFASKAVTDALRDALTTEFQAIGVRYIKTKLTERVSQGKMKHKLVLDLPVTKKLDEILSEGEQRAIAIAAFLAELHLAGHKGGIIFDDPVSSLDHHWRKNVAERLVKEAKERQVIILTHDTAFLGDLRDEIEQQGTAYLMHHLEWSGNQPGYVYEGLPWEHKSYSDRLDRHGKAQRELAKNWGPYPNEEDRDRMRHEYSLLRATIERVIQDVVFNGVVQRYRDWVRVDKLRDVVGFAKGEHDEIARLYRTSCAVVDAHDQASVKNASVPDPQQLQRDIEDLEKVIDIIKTRRKGGTN